MEIGDQLLIDMNLQSTIWNQTVTSGMSKKMVDFDIDMDNQPQRWALFIIEMPTSSEPSGDVIFTNTVMTFEQPEACKYSGRSGNDYVSAQVASADGTKCCISRIVLRAPGVMATTMDPPP